MNVPGKNRMFKFVTHTWNPIGGACRTNCEYCYAKEIAKHYQMAKYQGPAALYPHELKKDFKAEHFVFVSDMRDLFERSVPSEQIQSVLDFIEGSPAKFLLLTKHPDRYAEFDLPPNCVIGATVESDCDHLVSADAPKVWDRLHSLALVEHPRKMVSIEPIMRFTSDFEKRLIGMGWIVRKMRLMFIIRLSVGLIKMSVGQKGCFNF